MHLKQRRKKTLLEWRDQKRLSLDFCPSMRSVSLHKVCFLFDKTKTMTPPTQGSVGDSETWWAGAEKPVRAYPPSAVSR